MTHLERMNDPLISDYLTRPTRSTERRALELAVAALREISEETTTMGPEHTAEAVLDLILVLVPDLAK